MATIKALSAADAPPHQGEESRGALASTTRAGRFSDQSRGALTIISGGQTGVDRTALDFAIRAGLPHDGWCPRGRLAEDGPLDAAYRLRETPSGRYAERTEWNVRDSDATVLLTVRRELSGGTKLTANFAAAQGKPLLHLAAEEVGVLEAAVQLKQFLATYRVTRLNVAGPRASQEPTVVPYVDAVLSAALSVAPA